MEKTYILNLNLKCPGKYDWPYNVSEKEVLF